MYVKEVVATKVYEINPKKQCFYKLNLKVCAFFQSLKFHISFSLKVLSFMNSEFENQRKFPHLSMLFYQKKVRNLSFDRATGDWYL